MELSHMCPEFSPPCQFCRPLYHLVCVCCSMFDMGGQRDLRKRMFSFSSLLVLHYCPKYVLAELCFCVFSPLLLCCHCVHVCVSVCLTWVVRETNEGNGSNASTTSQPSSLWQRAVAITWCFGKIPAKTASKNPLSSSKAYGITGTGQEVLSRKKLHLQYKFFRISNKDVFMAILYCDWLYPDILVNASSY